MGFESRDYYRDSDYTGRASGWNLEYMPPVIKYLIAANIVVFLLQIFVTRPIRESELLAEFNQYQTAGEELTGEQRAKAWKHWLDYNKDRRESVVQDWFELDTAKVMQGQVWRLFTCAFCHDRTSVWHILFNMVALYWFGVTLAIMYGQREFFLFYMAAALSASLLHVLLDWYTGSRIPAVGASGAVLGVLMLYAIHYPRSTIRIIWFPIEVRWLVLIYLIFDLHPVLLALAGEQTFDGIGHAAHLGGLAFGFLYWKTDMRLESVLDRMRLGKLASLRHRPQPRPIVSHPAKKRLEQEMDDVLRKLHDHGLDSLSSRERDVLEQASRRLRDKLSS